MDKYTVKNNETGQERIFNTMEEAQRFCDMLIFSMGVDAEIQ